MSNYKKYTLLELKILEETFLKNSYYPNQKKIQLLSKILKRPTEKIDNWFKYKRRKLYFNGEISDYKIRKIFTSKENDQLNQIFKHFEKPNNQKSKEISSNLSGITENQVKNWFSNRRRKDRNEKCSSIKLKLKKKSPIKINLLKKLIRAQKNLNRSLKKSLIFEKTIQTNKQVIQTNIGLSLKSEEKNDYRANSNISSQTDSKKEEELTAKIEDMNKPSSNFLSFNYNNCNQNNLLLCKKIQIMNLMNYQNNIYNRAGVYQNMQIPFQNTQQKFLQLKNVPFFQNKQIAPNIAYPPQLLQIPYSFPAFQLYRTDGF